MAMNEARHKVSQLESAIKRVDSVKKHLSRNASGIKAEIHSSVSRHLECLRGREVSLLSQVDKVLSLKEETLQHQQAQLNQALGVLQTGLSMVQDDRASERQLADTLDKLSHLELSPEETPYISFRADHVNLRESILNYGRVDANGLPLMTAFDDPGNPSASLPRHLEEYEDVDHHVFYKTVEEVKRAKMSDSTIHVTIPKLSNRVEDWLQKKTPNPSPKPSIADSPARHLPAKRPSTLTKSGDTPAIGLSCSSTPGSSCSLNNWLSQIKQQSDLEEEHDFEIIDNSLAQKVASSMKLGTESSKTDNEDFFHHINKDLKTWLHSGSASSAKFSSDFFKHVPADTKLWLLQACQQLTSLDDVKQQDFFQHISKEPSTWLRSRAFSKQVETVQENKDGGDFFSHISKDKNFWLLKQNSAPSNEKFDQAGGDKAGLGIKVSKNGSSKSLIKKEECGKWLMGGGTNSSASQLWEVCRSNEVRHGTSEPMSQSDSHTMSCLQQPVAANAADPSQAFKPLSLPMKDWLAASPKNIADKSLLNSPKKSMCSQQRPNASDHSSRLAPPTSMPSFASQAPPPLVTFKDSQEKALWLQKAGTSSLSESFSSENFKSSSTCLDFCVSDWLMVPADSKERDQNMNAGEKEDSEGWSICSDVHNLFTDQHVQDVATAQEYFNKWLL